MRCETAYFVQNNLSKNNSVAIINSVWVVAALISHHPTLVMGEDNRDDFENMQNRLRNDGNVLNKTMAAQWNVISKISDFSIFDAAEVERVELMLSRTCRFGQQLNTFAYSIRN